MRSHPRSAIAALLACAASASAQTFVVDANNGPGTNFTDLPTAVSTVPDGAVLEVRPGSYSPFAIVSKGLSVIFAPGATLQNPNTAVVSVTGTSPVQSVLLRGLRIASPTSGLRLDQVLLANCQGMLLIEDCAGISGGAPRLVATNCGQLHAVRCRFGGSAIGTASSRLDNSSAVICSSTIASGGTAGLSAVASQLQFADTVVGVYQGNPSGPAILLQGGDLRMVGGGTYSFFNFAIDGTGTARVDPTVMFGGVGYNFTSFVAPTIQATTPTMPAVVATDGPLGGTVTVTLRGPGGDLGVLFAGFPGPPLLFPGIADPSWMLPGTEVVCTATVLVAGVGSAVTYAVPNAAALRGLRIVWQGASAGAANGIQASNPAVTTHW